MVGPDGGCVQLRALLLDEAAVGLRQTEYSFVGCFARRKGKLADCIRVAARLLPEGSATARSLRRRPVFCLQTSLF